MINITKEEIFKLAQLSQLEIHDAEAEKLRTDIAGVLDYVSRLKEVVEQYTLDQRLPKPINVMRADAVIVTDPAPILAQAPVHEDHYFVVPAILKSSGKL
jgi:aspartyl/glutamyl-tRNA(Asn/Gln) amidotransferase C subunit